ncbi:MAG: ribosome maturation factor RimM [Actinomycetota bacterium]|nr:ribosome maturation factor RimM [Actinomycetota bacterium]
MAVAPDPPTDLLVVGRIGRPQGLLGDVTVEVRTDVPDERFAVGAVLATDPASRGPVTVERTRDHSGRLVVRFVGVADRTAAEALRDTLLLVDPGELAPLDDPDLFHDFELVGLRAELLDGTHLGHVGEVLHLPHGDVLAIRREGVAVGSAEVLVPFVAAMVPVVDVAGGRVVLDPPGGLLDLSEPVVSGPDQQPTG